MCLAGGGCGWKTIGVGSGCGCKEINKYHHIIPTISLVHVSVFFSVTTLLFVLFLNVFRSCIYIWFKGNVTASRVSTANFL